MTWNGRVHVTFADIRSQVQLLGDKRPYSTEVARALLQRLLLRVTSALRGKGSRLDSTSSTSLVMQTLQSFDHRRPHASIHGHGCGERYSCDN